MGLIITYTRAHTHVYTHTRARARHLSGLSRCAWPVQRPRLCKITLEDIILTLHCVISGRRDVDSAAEEQRGRQTAAASGRKWSGGAPLCSQPARDMVWYTQRQWGTIPSGAFSSLPLFFFLSRLLWIRKKEKRRQMGEYNSAQFFFFNGLQNRRVLKRRMDDKRIKLHFLECLETLWCLRFHSARALHYPPFAIISITTHSKLTRMSDLIRRSYILGSSSKAREQTYLLCASRE